MNFAVPTNTEELEVLINSIQDHLVVLMNILKLSTEEKTKLFITKPKTKSQKERSKTYYEKNKDKICDKMKAKRKVNVISVSDDITTEEYNNYMLERYGEIPPRPPSNPKVVVRKPKNQECEIVLSEDETVHLESKNSNCEASLSKTFPNEKVIS
jgi:hypothetical protein